MRIGILFVVSVFCVKHAVGFSSPKFTKRVTTTTRHMLDPTLAILAGSVAGAAGSAVSMPLDKLKTLSQTRRYSHHDAPILFDSTTIQVPTISSPSLEIMMQNDTAAVLVPSMMVSSADMFVMPSTPYGQQALAMPPGMLQLAIEIWRNEGWKGFFSGSQAAILGTGLLEAVSFTTNACVLDLLRSDDGSLSTLALIFAASSAGITGSFILTPMDRIMATMQTKSALYSSEWECLADVVRQDGWLGFLTRGLGATMVREVPIECIYFGLYGYLMSTTLADTLGPFAPLFFGAISGCASWIPVFPIDTVRTLVQTQYDGESSESGWDIAQKVYRDRGIGAFFDGISPRLMRAALANAVTFYFYDLITSAAAV